MLPLHRAQVQSLVRELRSCMLHSAAKKKDAEKGQIGSHFHKGAWALISFPPHEFAIGLPWREFQKWRRIWNMSAKIMPWFIPAVNRTLWTGWLINNKRFFLTVLETGNPRSWCWKLWWEPASWFTACSLLAVSSHGGRMMDLSGIAFMSLLVVVVFSR